MKKNLVNKTMTMLLAFAVVFTMMPSIASTVGLMEAAGVYAASSVPGGTITSTESTESVEAKFGNKASVSRSGKTTTITLSESIDLEDPIVLQKADSLSEEHKIIIDLNGNNITGSRGKDAIIILSCSNFYIEIVGEGRVTGGEGSAVPVFNASELDASEGGCGVFFKNGIEDSSYYDYMSYNNLNCGLTISGGAIVEGGKGGSVTYEDWRDNFANNSGDNKHRIYAGNGGSGIGADFYNIYAKYEILAGEVIGGEGGDITVGDNIITNHELMKLQSIRDYLGTDNHSIIPAFHCGNGGDGIKFYGGRKYINVATGSKVTGGEGGMVKYGNTGILVTRSVSGSDGDGGNGINLYGDIGLGGKKVDYSCNSSADNYWGTNYTNIGSDSAEMGMYIAGTVMGGSTKNCSIPGDGSVTGGNGIYLNLNSEYTDYESDQNLGVIDVEGTVSGGNGGNGLRGNTGGGGDGLYEKGRGDGVAAFAKYYIVNGIIKGGNGGDSWIPFDSLSDTSRGNGGTGMSMTYIRADDETNERAIRNIAGNGSILGGDSGSMLIDGNNSSSQPGGGLAIDTQESFYTDDIVKLTGQVANNKSVGQSSAIIKNADYSNGVTVSVGINDTNLNSTLNAPGFNGKAFYTWTVTTFDSSGGSNNSWALESSGTDYSHFSILRNADYSNALRSNIDSATVERIVEDLNMNNAHAEIYCNVVLEDGRCVSSDPITLPARWDGSGSYSGGESGGGSESGGGEEQQDQTQIDQAAADRVQAMIEELPSISSITLDDEQAIAEAREAYNALTPAQKELLNPYVYLITDLENAEARIRELKIAAGGLEEITGLINELADPDEILTEADAQAQDNKLAVIYEMAAQLDDDSMQILAESAEDIARLAEVEKKVAELTGRNHIHLVCHKPARAATCVHDGNIEYYYCLTCDDGTAYIDPDCRLQLEGEVELWSDGESHVLRHVAASPATCLHTGTLEHYRCTECGNLFVDAEGTTMYTDESSVIIPADASKHVWDGGKVAQPATTSQAGIKKYTCTVCGVWRTETIPKLTPTPDPKPTAPAEVIDLPAVKISKPKVGKKKVTVKWKKISKKNLKKIQGIEVRVVGPGYDQTFPVDKKKTSKTVKGLKSKTKYTVSVRAYKWEGNTKHVSKLKSKKVKVK